MTGRFLIPVLCVVITVLLVAVVTVEIMTATHTFWYEQRLAPTVVLLQGARLYQGPSIEAPLFSCIYGPLSYLMYLPAALIGNRKVFYYCASGMSMVFLALPALLVYFDYRKQIQARSLAACMVGFFTLIVCLSPIAHVGSLVSADAPAIGFASLCALKLFPLDTSSPRRTAWWSSLFLALSVACKQNMLFLALPILVLLGLRPQGRRILSWYIPAAFVWTISLLLLFRVIYGDFGGIIFNNVIIPRRWPLDRHRILDGARFLYQAWLSPAFVAGGLLAIGYLSPFASSPQRVRECCLRPLFLAGCALTLLPISLMTFAAAGGTDNSFAHLMYFFSLSILVLSLELLSAYPSASKPESAVVYWQTIASVLILIATAQLKLSPFSVRQAFGQSPADTAYSFLKTHGDEVYFPTYPVSTYLATGHFVHAEWGIMNRILGGRPPSAADVWKFAPPGARLLAYPPGGRRVLIRYMAPHQIRTRADGLDGFEVYMIERPGS